MQLNSSELFSNFSEELNRRLYTGDDETYAYEQECINMYEFNYKGDSDRYRGAMANELVDSHPDAVIKDESGYYKLDYSKIDVDFERIS